MSGSDISWRKAAPKKRKSKFHNKVVRLGGLTFDSKLERDRWIYLVEMERQCRISKLLRQVPFEVIPRQEVIVPVKEMDGEVHGVPVTVEEPVRYYADFVYYRGDKLVIEDTKGLKTSTYIIKRKLMRLKGKPIREIKRADEEV